MLKESQTSPRAVSAMTTLRCKLLDGENDIQRAH